MAPDRPATEGVRYGSGIEPNSGRRQRRRRRKRPSRLWRAAVLKAAKVASSPGASEAEVSVRRAGQVALPDLAARTRTQLRRRGQLRGAHARLKGARSVQQRLPAAGVEVRDALQEFRLAFRAPGGAACEQQQEKLPGAHLRGPRPGVIGAQRAQSERPCSARSWQHAARNPLQRRNRARKLSGELNGVHLARLRPARRQPPPAEQRRDRKPAQQSSGCCRCRFHGDPPRQDQAPGQCRARGGDGDGVGQAQPGQRRLARQRPVGPAPAARVRAGRLGPAKASAHNCPHCGQPQAFRSRQGRDQAPKQTAARQPSARDRTRVAQARWTRAPDGSSVAACCSCVAKTAAPTKNQHATEAANRHEAAQTAGESASGWHGKHEAAAAP